MALSYRDDVSRTKKENSAYFGFGNTTPSSHTSNPSNAENLSPAYNS